MIDQQPSITCPQTKERKQKKSYEEFFAPVYVIDAITRAVESGKEEPIVKYEV